MTLAVLTASSGNALDPADAARLAAELTAALTAAGATPAAAGAAELRDIARLAREADEPVLITPSAKAVHPGYRAKAIETRQRSIDLALLRIPDALPERFAQATLTATKPAKDETVTVGGYGLARENDAIPDDIKALVEQRKQARAEKNWAESDRLRDEITARGFVLEDTPKGAKVRRA